MSLISLEPFTANDIPTLVSWVPDARFLLQFSGPTYQFDSFAQQLESDIQRMERTGKILMYKAVDDSNGKTVGHIQFVNVDRIHKSGWIGRVLVGASAARGKGVGTAMMEAILHIAFQELDLNEVGLSVYAYNQVAIRCYERLGFQEYERQTVFQEKAGEEWTTIRMKLHSSDYMDSDQHSIYK